MEALKTRTSFQGLEVIDDLITNNVKKLGFVSIWFSFAFALFLLNRFVSATRIPEEIF